MPPPPSRTDAVLDAVITTLEMIDAENEPDVWKLTPKSVRRGLIVGDQLSLERPRFSVQMLSWRPTPYGPTSSDATMRFGVHMIVDGDDYAEVNLGKSFSDVVKVMKLDNTLGNNVTDVQPVEYVPQSEAMERTGLGIATVVFDAMFTWLHAAP